MNSTNLVWLVEDRERPLIAFLRGVLEVVDIFADDFAVRDEKALPVDHVRNHHDLVDCLVGELEWRLRRLDIVGHNDRVRTFHALREQLEPGLARSEGYGIPQTDAYIVVHGDTQVVWDIVFTNVDDTLPRVLIANSGAS